MFQKIASWINGEADNRRCVNSKSVNLAFILKQNSSYITISSHS